MKIQCSKSDCLEIDAVGTIECKTLLKDSNVSVCSLAMWTDMKLSILSAFKGKQS